MINSFQYSRYKSNTTVKRNRRRFQAFVYHTFHAPFRDFLMFLFLLNFSLFFTVFHSIWSHVTNKTLTYKDRKGLMNLKGVGYIPMHFRHLSTNIKGSFFKLSRHTSPLSIFVAVRFTEVFTSFLKIQNGEQI